MYSPVVLETDVSVADPLVVVAVKLTAALTPYPLKGGASSLVAGVLITESDAATNLMNGAE